MAFLEDDKILIKVLRLEKGYGARRIKSKNGIFILSREKVIHFETVFHFLFGHSVYI